MKKQGNGLYWEIIKDYENMKASIEGPIFDETKIIERVIKKQQQGKHINCQPIPFSEMTEDELKEILKSEGYQVIDSDLLI